MKIKLFVILYLVLALFINGFGNEQDSQTTPKDTVQMFSDGFMEFDKAKVMASVAGEKSEMEALSVFMDYMMAIRDFKQAVIKEYGTGGWILFESEGGAKLSLNLTDNREKINSAKIEINGDKAACTIPGESQVIHLARKNGIWYVDAGGIIETGGSGVQKFISMWSSMTDLIKKKQLRIGQTGVTAESLDKELGAELLPILVGNR